MEYVIAAGLALGAAQTSSGSGLASSNQGARLTAGKSVPATINYQAYITHASDTTPLDTTADFTFRIFDAPTGGTELWSESQNALQVVNGILDTRLGVNNPLPPDIFYSGQTIWLQVEMGSEVFSPRKPIVSVGNAFYAQRADTAEVALNLPPAPDTVLFAYRSDTANYALRADTANYSHEGYHVIYADTADYARNVPSPGNYVQNQHSSVQSPGAFWLADSATVGSGNKYARLNPSAHAFYGQYNAYSYGWVGSSDSVGVYGYGLRNGVRGAVSTNTYGELGRWRRFGSINLFYGVYGYSTALGGVGVYGYSQTDVGTIGLSDSGTGVMGIGDTLGVYGKGSQGGVRGVNTTDTTTYGVLGGLAWLFPAGVIGYTKSSAGFGVHGSSPFIGVYGYSSNGTGVKGVGDTVGVYGESKADSSYGILGSSSHKSGVYGYSAIYGVFGVSPDSIGVNGYSSNGYGVFGASAHKFGVYGYVYGSDSGSVAVLAKRSSTSTTWAALSTYDPGVSSSFPYFGIIASSSISEGWAGWFVGDVRVTHDLSVENDVSVWGDLNVIGSKNNVIHLDDGRWVTMQASESPYAEYTLRGRARLVNGEATVEFEDPYPEVISDKVPVDVIITPIGSPTTIYVVKADRHGFTVKAKPGDPDCEFTWMAIGRRKGYEGKPDYSKITAKMERMIKKAHPSE